MRQPNILLLHSHDVGRLVQPYGYAIPTPHIQRFAESAVLFRQAFCAAPTCSPSRAALMTGMYPHECGMLGLAHRGFGLDDYSRHLATWLKGQGYTTALCGVQHEADDAAKLGYDAVLGPPHSKASVLAPVAAAYLAEPHEKPFFLSVGLFDTHREFPKATVDERYVRPPATMPDTPETRRDIAEYATGARAMDDAFGEVLDALDAAGLVDDTLVIMTTDHGPAFPGMKCSLTDHGLGVMLMIRLHGALPGGAVRDSMVSHLDVFPTICELAGLPKPGWLRGQSLVDLMQGEDKPIHDAVFGEVSFHAAYEPQRCVRTPRYKYIRRFAERSRPVLPNCDDSPSKRLWLVHGWADIVVESEQFYDLVFDPNEAQNITADPNYAYALTDMRERLRCWMSDTSDPLLDGPLYAPAGSRVCDVDAVGPEEGVVAYAERTRMA